MKTPCTCFFCTVPAPAGVLGAPVGGLMPGQKPSITADRSHRIEERFLDAAVQGAAGWGPVDSTKSEIPQKQEKNLRADLVPPEGILAAARAMSGGVGKYGGGIVPKPAALHYAALLRHLLAWASGETTDAESGLSPLDHVAARALLLVRAAELDKPGEPRYRPIP